MHFENNTWRLPSPPNCPVRPLLETALSDQEIPADISNNLPLNWDKEYDPLFSEEQQRTLELQTKLILKVKNYHDSLGHCNNRLLAHSLKKMGVSVKNLLPYINAYKCNACTTNLGWSGYLLTSTTASITQDKDTVTTPSQLTTSVINPAPIIEPLSLSLPQVPVHHLSPHL